MRPAHRIRPVLTVLVLLLAGPGLSGCNGWWGKGDDENARAAPDQIYSDSARDMQSGNYKGAVEKLELLESRFPFSNAAKQGQLDLMYAYYKNLEFESAVDQADQFIRENPAHPRVDYAYYLRGLVFFESGANWLERLFRADVTKRPPSEARKSLQAFQLLLQAYPRSPYAADSRQRMIYLRNRLADYELAVARYYMQRGAYVGAVNRARSVIETYDGSPAALEALRIMSDGYRELGIDDLAKVARNVYETNMSLPAIIEPDAAAAGLAASQAGTQPGAGGPDYSETPRGGRWEGSVGLVYQNSGEADFEGGTKVDFDSGLGFVAGFGYNFTDRLSLGGSFSYDDKDYVAAVAGDEPGETFQVKGDMTTMSLMVDGAYNFLTGRFTPYVAGGIGWSWVDTNIATEPPEIGCWWNPWYGYVCTSFQDTKTLTGFAYELGVGLRYDFSDYLVADGMYKMKWVDLENATGTPSFDGFQMNLGWKF